MSAMPRPDWKLKAEHLENENVKLRTEAERLRTVLRSLYEWYDRDGSVGGASQVFEDNRAALEGK